MVLVGHLTNNRLAVGIDHLIYGWLFFGVVIAAVFYIGTRFSDTGVATTGEPPPPRLSPLMAGGMGAFALATVAAICLAAVGPVLAQVLEAGTTTAAVVLDPPAAGEWQATSAKLTDWKPPFPNPTASVNQAYRSGDDQVGVYVAYYRNQRSGAKLLSFGSTTLADYDSTWRVADRRVVTLDKGGGRYRVIEKVLQSPSQNLLTWQWYWIGGQDTVSFWDAKLMQAHTKLLGRGDDSAVVVIYAPYKDHPSAAREALTRFVEPLRSGMKQTLSGAANR